MTIALPIEEAFESVVPLEIIIELGRCLRSVELRTLRMGRSGRVLSVIGNPLLQRLVTVVGTMKDTRVSRCLNSGMT